MWPNPQETEEKVLNGKLKVLCSDTCENDLKHSLLQWLLNLTGNNFVHFFLEDLETIVFCFLLLMLSTCTNIALVYRFV